MRETFEKIRGVLNSLPLLVNLLIGAGLAYALVIIFMVMTGTFYSFRDGVSDWWFDRKDSKAAAEVQQHLDRVRILEATIAEKDAAIAERDAKYNLAIAAMTAAGQNGAEIDERINQQIERMEERGQEPLPSTVPDDVLLEQLRRRDSKPARRN